MASVRFLFIGRGNSSHGEGRVRMGGGRKEGYSEHADSNTGINVVKVNIYIHI